MAAVKPDNEVAPYKENTSAAVEATPPVADKPVVSVKLSKDPIHRQETKRVAPPHPPKPPQPPISPQSPGSVQQRYRDQNQNYSQQQGSPKKFITAFLMVAVFIIFFITFLVITSRITDRVLFNDIVASPAPVHSTDAPPVPVEDMEK